MLSKITVPLDSNGNYVVKYKYDAWGNVLDKQVLVDCIVSNHNPLLYKGYVYDEETKWYYLQSRYYIPEIGRFLSPDSIDYADPETIGGLNLYAYCNNDSINYCDSSGHSAILIGLIIGAIIGTTLGFATVAYSDYKDDGELFNGSVNWKRYLIGTLTGAALGAGVGGIIGAGGAVLTSAMISLGNKFLTDFVSFALTGSSFGKWEDYAIAFIYGGFIEIAKPAKFLKVFYDVVARPYITQIVKIGLNKQNSFNSEKFAFDLITRGVTTFVPAPWKAVIRGIIKSIWDSMNSDN